MTMIEIFARLNARTSGLDPHLDAAFKQQDQLAQASRIGEPNGICRLPVFVLGTLIRQQNN
jgi:hypothetical protein